MPCTGLRTRVYTCMVEVDSLPVCTLQPAIQAVHGALQTAAARAAQDVPLSQQATNDAALFWPAPLQVSQPGSL